VLPYNRFVKAILGAHALRCCVLATATMVIAGTTLAAQEQERLERLEQQVTELRARLDSLSAAPQDSTTLAELRLQIEAITRELERLQLGSEVVTAGEGRFGLGPAASKVYQVQRGVSIGGYGEMLYQKASDDRQDGTPSGRKAQIDFLRAVFYFGYKFNDRLLFNSEIELEHASTDQSGSVSVEFAYLDYFLNDDLAARAGLLLVPMGFLNELHEPPTFLGTTRPETERAIIPSTWRENGFGLLGEISGFSYRAYLVNGLDAVGGNSSNASGFSSAGLRGGRQKGSQAVAENWAGVVRADYVGLLGLTVGASAYLGNSGQGATDSTGAAIGARTFILEGHAEYRAKGWYLRALATLAEVDDVDRLNAARGLSANQSIGERLAGWYLEGGYNVLRTARTEHQLIPYLRYEELNTQDRVPNGYSPDPANDRSVFSIGAMWKPIPNVALKSDYQFHSNAARTGVDQWNVAVGYLF